MKDKNNSGIQLEVLVAHQNFKIYEAKDYEPNFIKQAEHNYVKYMVNNYGVAQLLKLYQGQNEEKQL